MSRLRNRVQALEAGMHGDLPPALKKWLGHTLTVEEQRALDADSGIDTDFDTSDTSDWSQEMKAWLGVG